MEQQTNKKDRKRGIAYRSALLFFFIFILLSASVLIISYRNIRTTLIEEYSKKIQTIVQIEAGLIDGDSFKAYSEGADDTFESELKGILTNARKADENISYLYAFVPYDNHFVYIYDTMLEGENPADFSAFGDKYIYGDMEINCLLPDVKAKKASSELIFGEDVGFGESVSAWAPIFDSASELVGMVEGDYLMVDLNSLIMKRISGLFLLLIIGLSVFFVLILYLLRSNITTPLSKLVAYVDSYEEGTFTGEKFSYKRNDEIHWLETSFNEMQDKIEQYIDTLTKVTAEKERIGAELNVATQIQANMLPSIFPAFPERKEFDIYATMTPAKEVGGDFYDFFLADENHLAVVMADVSGKGVPAALFMVIAKTLIKNRTQMGGSPAEILSDVNDQLCEGNEAELFVTVWLAIIEISTGKGVASNAGHEYPVIKRKDGEFELIKNRHSPAVATMEGIPFRQVDFELNPGDRLFVYTDGVAEATSSDNELFGTDRMLESLNSHKDASLEEILHGMKEDIDAFVGDAPQFDDITMLGLDYFGARKG